MPSFDEEYPVLFHRHFDRLTRVLDRLSGDAELAADVVQDAFVRLHQRASMPDAPEAWLITVALNLLRNAQTTRRRRERLLSVFGGDVPRPDHEPPDATVAADDARLRVRAALDGLPERDRQLLLLRAEDYSYRDLARALGIHEASVGTLLARAKEAFRDAYTSGSHAS